VAFIYALTFSLVKDVMPYYIQGFGFVVIRVVSVAILFFFVSKTIAKEKVDWKKHGPRMLLCSVLGVVANMLMFFKGLEITTPINGAVLMLATPIFVLLLNVFINKQKLYVMQVFGILVACAGCLVLMKGKAIGFSTDTLPGDLLILMNAISYAGYLVYVKDLLKHYHPLTVSKYTFAIGAVLVLPFGFGELMDAKFTEMGSKIIIEIVYVVLFTTFLTYLLNAWAIEKAGPTLVGAYIYLQPILASLIAIQLGKDELNMQKILAIMLIFAGVYLTSNTIKWYKSKA
jgi:drug/metabolite transporter (DMT)-like permease